MKTGKYILIFAFFIFYGCATSPDFPDTPAIAFRSFTKTTLRQGSINNDSTFLSIYFEDGDGDIGFEINNPDRNLFITDTRTGEFYDQFKIPELPIEGAGNGISGTIKVLLFTTCCIFPDNIPPCESPDLYPTNELIFEVYLEDRAGNRSNTVTTPPLELSCD